MKLERFEFTNPSCGIFRGMNNITEDKPGKPGQSRSVAYYALRLANRFNHRSRRILFRSSSQRGSHPWHLTSAPILCMVARLPIVGATRFRAIKLLLDNAADSERKDTQGLSLLEHVYQAQRQFSRLSKDELLLLLQYGAITARKMKNSQQDFPNFSWKDVEIMRQKYMDDESFSTFNGIFRTM
jgi:hypothetical protein